MKYLICILGLLAGSLVVNAQNQLELIIPVGLSGISASSQDNFSEAEPEATFSFEQGISSGAMLRYAFGLHNRFHLVAALGYQRWNAVYTRTSETTEPVYLLRSTEYTYTDHSLLAGLNFRYRIIEDRAQGLALQAKTQLGMPFAGEYQEQDSRLFDPSGEPEETESSFNDLIYIDENNVHLQLGGGLIYTYHFSKWSFITEINYLYKYHLTGHARSDGFAIDWQDVNIAIGLGYVLGSSDTIEGNQDAFFKIK